MTNEEKKLMGEGDPEPDIVKEGRAALFCLLLFVCAVLLLALLLGVFYGVYELVQYIIG